VTRASVLIPGGGISLINASDVARWRLCVGCGACVIACDRKNIVLRDVTAHGIRPTTLRQNCDECRRCIGICPGLGGSHTSQSFSELFLVRLQKAWGPILEIWEGYAVDAEVRCLGSSGGTSTAIALYCLHAGHAGGVVHVGKDEFEPWRNTTVTSRTREELLIRAGSRYSPASPCDGLDQIEAASRPSIFIGKPCDIQGLRNTEKLRPQLQTKVALALGIFCAGTPATVATLELLASLQVSKENLQEIRYRGNGWPGAFSVRLKNESNFSAKLSYTESWRFLQVYRPFRCYLCPDGTSEFADISCGDPWYREPSSDETGRSLVLVRTERGREMLKLAEKAGYVHLERVEPEVLELSQKNLLMKRRAIWGRILTMKAFGLPAPRFDGFQLFENWLELPFREKARSFVGTARRILQRKYHRPIEHDRSRM